MEVLGGGRFLTTRGPLWGYLKSQLSETLSIFGDEYPQNGSKNEHGMPPRRAFVVSEVPLCPHSGLHGDFLNNLGVENP